ncbi:MAG: dihydroorotase [bacterium]|nr:dihydroorotase [bacterium]
MNILIKQARVISEGSDYHNRTMDLLIEGGEITEMKSTIAAKGNVKVIEAEGLCVSTGWVDMQAVSCDPGFEHKETLESMMACAAAGGFTTVCVHNYNQPALHTKAQIEYLLNKSKNKIVEVLPLGTITQEGKGKDMAEMYDMKLSGAVAFSDYKHVISDAGTVLRALQYANNIDSFIVTHCNDGSISAGGQMSEGETATSLGLKGIPALAEELMVQRNISILEYTGGKLHIPTISTRGSVELIKKAKSAGLGITCGVAAVNLFLDDSCLVEFDTNYKLDPPLRTKKDVHSLRSAVESGIIDVIVSDHLPQDSESKELEFDHADNGMINLQTAFNCALEGLKEKSGESIVRAFTTGPRRILNMEEPFIKAGAEANLTLFSLSEKTILTESSNNSKSKNSPFFGRALQGRVVGVVRGSKSYFN